MNEVVCRYGVPASLHSDQGANLCSAVVQELCQLLGIDRTRTSAYHPASCVYSNKMIIAVSLNYECLVFR